MPEARLGTQKIRIARKIHYCFYCEQFIPVGESYKEIVGKTKRTRTFWVTSRLHRQCSRSYEDNRWDYVDEHKDDPIERIKPEVIKGKLFELTPEQRRRRKTLQTYLNGRDKINLIKAYERKDTQRVFTVLRTIASRWQELADMGVKFRATLIFNNRELDVKLRSLIEEHDKKWFGWQLTGHSSINEKIQALQRTTEEGWQPRWSSDEEYIEKEIDPSINWTPEEVARQRELTERIMGKRS